MKIEKPLNKSCTKGKLIATLRPYKTNAAMLTFNNKTGFEELTNCWVFKAQKNGFKILISLNDTKMNKFIINSLIETFKQTFKFKDEILIITPENKNEVEMIYNKEDLQQQLEKAMKDMREGFI